MANNPSTSFFCPSALLPTGWANDVHIACDEAGNIASVQPNADPESDAIRVKGPVIPGVPNVHSHAFQYAMAGLAEFRVAGQDSFWSWRETMYKFLDRLDPDDFEVIAKQLYVEMLKHGYTSVGEFHYVHHQPEGKSYSNPAELAERHIVAAKATGIGITMLPVFYQYGGFDKRPLEGGQKRFFHNRASYLTMLEGLHQKYRGEKDVRLGFAAHSLRAVAPEDLREAVETVSSIDATMPRHIHVAEQQAEVDTCLAAFGKRPVELLFSALDGLMNQRWCLIHATHMTAQETAAVAEAGAVPGLCPTTEANLGDGFFSATEFAERSDYYSIGSDSHVSVSPWEELRTLEYGIRLRTQRRNLLATDTRSTGASMLQAVLQGGQYAMGRNIGEIRQGARADFAVLNANAALTAGRAGDQLIDALVFCGDSRMIRDVFVGGRHVIQDGRHPQEEIIGENWRSRIGKIISSI